MNRLEQLHQKLDQYHLLKHPFYQAWNMGSLDMSTLQTYAKEYYHHVAAFPRYISSIHSKCSDLKTRQVLLGNLIEEEQGEDNHPTLWKNFAEGIGCASSEIDLDPKLANTKKLVDGYFELTESSFAEGLGALYAYERQTPSVATSKIEGLQKFYNVSSSRALQFFEVHIKADEWHSDECAALIANLDEEQQNAAEKGAVMGAKLLWEFLDGMMEIHEKSSCYAHC